MSEDTRIAALRDEIDTIDTDLIDLLCRRAACAEEIGKAKQSNGMPTLDLCREADVIKSAVARNNGPLPDLAMKRIFTEIISACRALQSPTRVSYLGPEATFSHMAAVEHFGKSCDFQARNTIVDVFRDVESGQAEFGVVPVENSTEGAVGLTLDQLAVSGVKVCGELLLPVSHALMSRETDIGNIETVFSHPQALAQCFGWITRNLPGTAMVEMPSTAASARRAANEPRTAAVGSVMQARYYGLNVLARDIQDRAENLTRFFILGAGKCRRTGMDKTSVLFTTPHQPGALRRALTPFEKSGINLSRIESRPSKERPWDYIFFVDFEGHVADAPVKAALDTLKKCVEKLRILGCYPQGQVLDGRSLPAPGLTEGEDTPDDLGGACPGNNCSNGKTEEPHSSDVASGAAG